MEQPESHTWTVYIDGASRNNPGKAGAGIVLKKDGQNVAIEGFYLGVKTNNQAEYLALLLALYFVNKYATSQDVIRIVSDSQLLVRQFLGQYRVKNEGLKPLHHIAQQWAQQRTIEILHVLRADNKEADALANKGIDSKKPLPSSFIEALKEYHVNLT